MNTCRSIDLHALERSPVIKLKSCEAPHSDNDLVHYIIVRGDLTTGQKFAQGIHAAGESVTERVPKNTVVVALQVKDQEELLELDMKLIEADIPHVLICECDGEPQSIGIELTRDRAKIRRLTSHLPLIK